MPILSYAPYGTKCYVREATCKTKKSVSDGLCSWYGSLSNAFQQLLRKLFKIVNVYIRFVCVCVLSITYSKEITSSVLNASVQIIHIRIL